MASESSASTRKYPLMFRISGMERLVSSGEALVSPHQPQALGRGRNPHLEMFPPKIMYVGALLRRGKVMLIADALDEARWKPANLASSLMVVRFGTASLHKLLSMFDSGV